MPIDNSRHVNRFDPFDYQHDTFVIGAGALGGRCITGTTRLGVVGQHVFDPDVVEGVNIANQVFLEKHIGMPKAEAMQALVQEIDAGASIVPHVTRFDGSQPLSGIVFVMVDDMEVRKEIWEHSIRGNEDVSLMIEARMGFDGGKTFAVNPTDEAHIAAWESHWHPMPVDVEPACRSPESIGYIADLVVGFSIRQFVRWKAYEDGEPGPFVNAYCFSFFDEKGDASEEFSLVKEMW